jgi:polynucleotide 5'-kinase involved in rRNA processing
MLTDPTPKLSTTDHSTEREISDAIRFSLQRNGKLEERYKITTNYVISNAKESKVRERRNERKEKTNRKLSQSPLSANDFGAIRCTGSQRS